MPPIHTGYPRQEPVGAQPAAAGARKVNEGLKVAGLKKRAKVKRYLIIIENAGENLSAYSPDLPGCVATGKTRAEVEANMQEAIRMPIEGLRQDGLPVPEPQASADYVTI